MIEGSCLCGAVHYEAELGSQEPSVTFCHCEYCRKNSGSAFSNNLGVRRSGFRITKGKESLRSFESSPGKLRYFCGTCGSPLFHIKASDPDTVTLKMGSIERFDEFDGPLPSRHIFRESAARSTPWLDL